MTAKMSALADSFSVNDLPQLWSNSYGTVAVANGQCGIKADTSYDSGLFSSSAYDLTSSYLFAKVIPYATATSQTGMRAQLDDNDYAEIGYYEGTLYAKLVESGSTAGGISVTYSAVQHQWWRIRESAGTLYFDASPDGKTWVNQWSASYSITLTAVYATVYGGLVSGTAATSYVSYVNVVPFPDSASGVTVEADIGGTWTDLTPRLDHGPLEIARGHPDESTTVSPSTLSMTLTNSDGALSEENPESPLYPWWSQNVPVRVSLPAPVSYLRLEDDQLSYASCPDSSALHITGDIDIRADVKLTSWAESTIAAKYSATGGEYAWLIQLNSTGCLQFYWSTTGSDFPSAVSTAPLPSAFGRYCIRVTLAVSTGTVTFYTGPAGNADSSSGWTQLGNAVVSGSTSIFAGTAALTAGNRVSGTIGMYGNVYELEVRSGIGGTVKAHPVFSLQPAGTTSFSDAESNTWTLSGTAEISSRSYRGYFEAAEIPSEEPPFNPLADEEDQETDVLSVIAGGGLLRREGQRNNPVDSAMYRAWTRAASGLVAAYWPMEDGTAATSIASGIGGAPMYFGGSALPELASNSDFTCSNPLPVVHGSAFSGQVAYSGTWTDNQIAFLMEVPSAGDTAGAPIAAAATSGTIATLGLFLESGGGLNLTGYSSTGAQLFTSGTIAFAVDGQQLLVAISLQNAGGGSITWHIDAYAPGAASSTGFSGSVSGTVGAVTRVQLNPSSTGGLLTTVLGHCAVLTEYTQLFNLFTYVNPFGLTTGALDAWAGEPAAVRFARLCTEEGVPYRVNGNSNGSVLVGPQTPQTLTQLLQECADADRGVWYELRQQLGWGYACRSALYNQAAQVTVDYDQDHLSQWTSPPLRDDQVIVNDATVTQSTATSSPGNGGSSASVITGSSARAYAAPGQPVTGGRLSTLAPSAGGAGTYDQTYELNLYQASDLPSEATWIVHVGTCDRKRFPGVMLDLTNRAFSSLQFWEILDLDLGQRLVINDPPPWLGFDPVSQLAQQLTETLDAFTISVGVCGVPEQPYETFVVGTSHIDTDGTTLGGARGTTDELMLFVTASGYPLWTTAQADFPFSVKIAGEVVTVTDISGPPGNFLSASDATFEGSIGTWNAAGNCTIADSSAAAHSGADSLAMTSSASGTMTAAHCTAGTITSNGMACTAGDTIEASAWFLAAASARSVAVGAQFYTSGGASISSLFGSSVTDSTTGWTKVTASLTAPATAAYCRLLVEVLSTGGASEVHYVDDCAIGDVTSGSAVTQTATVTRSVNGVVKSQAAGAAVNVYPPPVLAL